jgi:hypothetical protein
VTDTWPGSPPSPVVTTDVTVLYLSGARDDYFLQHDRGDRLTIEPQGAIRLALHPTDDTVEDVLINQAAVASLRTTVRTQPADDVTPEPD